MDYSLKLLERASLIQCLICDVDGVLTNGHITYSESGEELKSFNSLDGLGLKTLQSQGIHVAIITSRQSPIVTQRMQELGIEHLYQGQKQKLSCFMELKTRLDLKEQNIAYVGDDLPDLSAINAAGLGVAVANAHPIILQHAQWVTSKAGGQGAVREVCDLILTAHNKMESIIEHFLSH